MILLEKLIFLRSVEIFKKIKDETLIEIAANMELERLPENSFVYKIGDEGDSLYIIVAGSVAMLNESDTLAVLKSKQMFGELATLSPEKRIISIKTLEECLLLKLKHEHIVEMIAIDSSFSLGIIEALCQRIRAISTQLLNVTKK